MGAGSGADPGDDRADAGAERAARDAAAVDWDEVFGQSPVGLALVSPDGIPVAVNDALAGMLGYRAGELRGMPFREFTHPEDVEKDLELYRDLVDGKIDHYRTDKRFLSKDGDVVWGGLYVTRAPGDRARAPRCVAFVRDITDRRRAEEELRRSEERYRSLFENSRDAIVLTDRSGTFHQANRAFLELTGYSRDELEGMSAPDLYVDPERRRELVRRLEESGHVQEFEFDIRDAEGEVIHCRVTTSLRPAAEDGAEIQAIVRDVSDQKEREAALRRRAMEDSLTGLPNRNLLMDRLKQALAAAERSSDGSLAVLFVDLDGFKAINDRHGHAVGDRMLRKIADRLSGLVRESDTVSRYGGDEFVILLRELEAVEEAELVARRICEAAGGVDPIEASPTGLTVSVGVATVAEDDRRAMSVDAVRSDPVEIIRRADHAMYRAKEEGGSSYWVHHAGGESSG